MTSFFTYVKPNSVSLQATQNFNPVANAISAQTAQSLHIVAKKTQNIDIEKQKPHKNYVKNPVCLRCKICKQPLLKYDIIIPMQKNSSCKIFIVFFLILIFSFFNSIFAQKFTNENNFTYSANLSAATNINNALMDLEESKSIIDEVYNQNQIIPSPVKPQNRPSVALVLSGGGARGFAHLPVLEMIEDYGIPVDMIIGTSIGSIIGGIYSSGYTVSEMEEQFFSLNWSEIFQDKVQELYETRLGKSEKNATPFSIDFKKTNNGFNLNLGSGILSGQYAYELIKK